MVDWLEATPGTVRIARPRASKLGKAGRVMDIGLEGIGDDDNGITPSAYRRGVIESG